ncbi:YcxB family protein [Pedobacter frigoris]|uniref:YcxB family protein n=1 Tax=Pedobacter frigoris TaxID=2571272 RepID=UPI0029308B94|nr:YcxB family protein [Pedobacter frigoris]
MKKKTRRKSFIFLLVIGVFMVSFGLVQKDNFLLYYGLTWTLLVLCFGNIYIKWKHKRHYTKHVKNRLENSSGGFVQVEIGDERIRVIDDASDSSVKLSEVRSVDEIRDIYFIKLSPGQVLVIPKTIPELNKEIEAIIQKFNIPHIQQLDWKW